MVGTSLTGGLQDAPQDLLRRHPAARHDPVAAIGQGEPRVAQLALQRPPFEQASPVGEVEHIGGTQFSGTRKNGTPFTDEDAPKKSVTDALVKALSMIGFAGDIFMGRYDDSKYVQELRDEARQESSSAPSGRNATPAVPRTSSGTVAPPSQAFLAFREVMRTARSKADLREWWFATKDQIAEELNEAEGALLVGERNTLAQTLPEFAEAA